MKVFSLRNLAILVILGAVVAGLYFWQRLGGSVPEVRVAKATIGNLTQTFRTNGVVEPAVYQEIRAAYPTRVISNLCKEGDLVYVGQSLAHLDPIEAFAALAQAKSQLLEAEQALVRTRSNTVLNQLDSQMAEAKADLSLAESRLHRDELLVKQRAISQLEFEQSKTAFRKASDRLSGLERDRKAQVQDLGPLAEQEAKSRVGQAQAMVEKARKRLNEASVPSPLNGTVLVKPPRPGSLVNAGDLLGKVGNLDHLQVRAFIDQPDFSSIQIGSTLTITFNGLPGETWLGKVTSLSAELTTVGKRVVGEAVCSIENGRSRLPVNANVDLTFTSRELREVLLVPIDAVIQKDNRNYVYAVRRGLLALQDVQVGASSADYVVVRSGLKAGDLVFSDLEVQPRQGLRVQPR